MGNPVLELQVAANWEVLYSESLEALPGSTPNSYVPIPSFELPITIDKHILAVKTQSVNANPRWYLAAYLSQIITIPGFVLEEVEPSSQIAKLNGDKLIVFPKLSTDYKLKITIPHWIQDLTINIWQYIGPESDSTEDMIAEVQATLSGLTESFLTVP